MREQPRTRMRGFDSEAITCASLGCFDTARRTHSPRTDRSIAFPSLNAGLA
jgi:hypothetical protein